MSERNPVEPRQLKVITQHVAFHTAGFPHALLAEEQSFAEINTVLQPPASRAAPPMNLPQPDFFQDRCRFVS